jgi:hypothetical protein
MRYFAPVLLALLAVAATPNAALAAYPYTLNVPGTVNNLSAFQKFQVECGLYTSQNSVGPLLTTATSPLTTTTVAGFYSRTLSIALNSPSLPASYKCWIVVYNSDNSVANVRVVNGNPVDSQPGWTGTMVTTKNF